MAVKGTRLIEAHPWAVDQWADDCDRKLSSPTPLVGVRYGGITYPRGGAQNERLTSGRSIASCWLAS